MTPTSGSPPPSVLRARSTPELVGVVPVLLGFHPEESLVALCVHGERGRLGLALRLDLPDPGSGSDVRACVAEVVQHVSRQEPTGVLLVLHSRRGEEALPVLEATRVGLAEAGVHVLEAARTDGARVWSTTCPDRRCCPAEGWPYDAAANPMLASAVVDGHEVLPDRDALVRRFDPVPVTEAVRRATAEVVAEQERIGAGLLRPDAHAGVVGAGWAQCLAAVERATRAGSPDDHDVAVLSVWAGNRTVRDLLWTDVDRESCADLLVVWREVGRRCLPEHRADPLALAGFAAWLRGDGAVATTALERALDAAPGHSMSGTVLAAVTGGVDPRCWSGHSAADVARAVPGLDPARPVRTGTAGEQTMPEGASIDRAGG